MSDPLTDAEVAELRRGYDEIGESGFVGTYEPVERILDALPRLLAERDTLLARAEKAERERDLAERAAVVCREDAETSASRAESAEVRCSGLRTRAESAEAELVRLRDALREIVDRIGWTDGSAAGGPLHATFMALNALLGGAK